MNGLVTPVELARELGVSDRTIRAYLRKHYAVGHLRNARWELTEAQAAEVRRNFRS